jgi:hypothetical protein
MQSLAKNLYFRIETVVEVEVESTDVFKYDNAERTEKIFRRGSLGWYAVRLFSSIVCIPIIDYLTP